MTEIQKAEAIFRFHNENISIEDLSEKMRISKRILTEAINEYIKSPMPKYLVVPSKMNTLDVS